MKHRGFTLVEMLIALAISITALTLAVQLFKNFTNLYTQNLEILESEGDLMNIERDLKRYFDRAVAIAITQRSPPGPTPNFALARAGAAILISDMRRCGTFNPLNSAVAGNRSQVRISCCDRNQSLTAAAPLGIGNVNITSRCQNTRGLSFEVVRGATVEYSRCYSSVSELDISVTGFDFTKQASIYYWNVAIPSGLTLGGNNAIAQLRSRLQLYLAPGFNGLQEAVTCQEPVGFGV